MRVFKFMRLVCASLCVAAVSACHVKIHGPIGQGPDQDIDDQLTEGLRVSADFFGDYYGSGYNNFILLFQIGKIDPVSNKFIGYGEEVSIDLLTVGGSKNELPVGTYYIGNRNHNAAGIVPSTPWTVRDDLLDKGVDISGYPESALDEVINWGNTYLYRQSNSENYSLSPLDDAKLLISRRGGQYYFSLEIESGYDDYDYYYIGPLSIVDRSQELEAKEVVFNRIGGISARYEGDVWGIGASTWNLFLDNADRPNEFLSIEWTTSAVGTQVPVGSYNIPKDFYTTKYKNMLHPLYYSDDVVYGTYYGRENQDGTFDILYAPEDERGWLAIDKKGDVYTISLNFYDKEMNVDFSCDYIGTIVAVEIQAATKAEGKTQRSCGKAGRTRKASLSAVNKATAGRSFSNRGL